MNKVKKVEERLELYRHYETSIENLEEELELLEDRDGLGAMSYDQVSSSQTNKINNIVEDIGLSNVERKDYVDHLIKMNRHKIKSIDRAIAALNEDEQEVINGFYFEGQTARYIADKIKVSDPQVYKLKQKALTNMSICIFGE